MSATVGDRATGGEAVFVGIGANLGDPVAQICEAFERLAADVPHTRLIARSRLYRNPPMGPQDQPDYVNAVASLETRLEPEVLLAALQDIEHACGRIRDGRRWGPRLLDLDILLFGDRCIRQPGLQVPHVGIAERDFVVLPLQELAPTLEIPGHGPVARLARRFDGAGLVAIAEPGAGDGPGALAEAGG
ncbi:MAG: 2-amino-4-hydroxy-6-hydroxymethyldihydropteridine diphosphokinase [Pseudomonadota bacterium]